MLHLGQWTGLMATMGVGTMAIVVVAVALDQAVGEAAIEEAQEVPRHGVRWSLSNENCKTHPIPSLFTLLVALQ